METASEIIGYGLGAIGFAIALGMAIIIITAAVTYVATSVMKSLKKD